MADAAASSGHRGGRRLVGRHSVALRRPRRAARARRVSVHADLRAQRRVAPPRHRGQVRRPGRPDRVAADHARPARRRPPAAARQHDGAFEELIGMAWISIRCCPVERQPTTSPPISSATPPTGRSRRRPAGDRPPRSRSIPRVSTRHRRRRRQPVRGAGRLVADGRHAGMTTRRPRPGPRPRPGGVTERLAAERKVTPRTIRNHRDRVTAQLRPVSLTKGRLALLEEGGDALLGVGRDARRRPSR